MSTLKKRVYSRTFCSGHAHGISCSCDFCGEEVPSDKILEIEDLVYLCQSCFNYFEDLPEGKIKESIKEFLIGNVILEFFGFQYPFLVVGITLWGCMWF